MYFLYFLAFTKGQRSQTSQISSQTPKFTVGAVLQRRATIAKN